LMIDAQIIIRGSEYVVVYSGDGVEVQEKVRSRQVR
jgi:hypothetical protein